MNENINSNIENIKTEEKGKLLKINNIFTQNIKEEINIKNSENNNINIQNRKSIDKGKNLGTFILGQKLGEGTFGVVRLATHILTGEKVAVKILDKQKISKNSDKKRLEREIKILKIMHHNNIVQLYNVIETSQYLYLVMENIDGKELFDYIIHKRRLSELEACKFYQQLISCIEYLGKMKITHRDLKPENLLLDKKKNIKLVDFGLSNIYKNNELLTTPCGSPSYAAPEMLKGEKYNGLNVDIWSSGIVLYAMICGCLPFEDTNNDALYSKIKKGVFKTPEFLSDNANDLLHKILNIDPIKRYNIEQIKAHPWFNIINPKIYMSEGLLINTYIMPIDEEIIDKMANEYEYNSIEVRINLLANKHNHLTTTYYLLLKKKINKGGKSIGNMCSSEFKKYIRNKENFISNYHGNWKLLFKERAGDRNKKEENKKNDEKMENNNNRERFIIIENINKNDNDKLKNDINFYKNINSYLTNEKKDKEKNNNKIFQENNEFPKQIKEYNNYNNNNNNIKKTINNETEKEPQKKKPTIFEYLKKIKEIKKKSNCKEENNFSENTIQPKEETPKKELTFRNDSGPQTERKTENIKNIKEYENKIRDNRKKIVNTKKDKDYQNQKNNIEYNNYFDLKQYLNEKKKKNNIRNILSDSNKIHFDTNTFNNIYYKEKDNNNANELYNDNNQIPKIEHESSSIIKKSSKNKQKKFIRHKYVESRYFNSHNSNIPKVEEYLNNSFKNINNFDDFLNQNNKNKKGSNNLNEKDIINKTINLNYIQNKSPESSLDKRKKYSKLVNPKIKNIKNKDKNNSSLIMNDENIFGEKKETIISHNKIIDNYLNSKSNKSRNVDSNESFGVNYGQKRKLRNGLFNSKNIDKKKFLNSNIKLDKTYNDIRNNRPSLINKNKTKYLINNQINRTYNNSHKKQNHKEYIKNKVIENKIKLKPNNNNINNANRIKINKNYNKDKKIDLFHNTQKNINPKMRNNKKTNININKSKSIENYKEKNIKQIFSKKVKINLNNNKISNINTNNCSKKIIIDDYISNTQRYTKHNKKRRIIKNNEFNMHDDTLIKSYADINNNKYNNSTYNANDMHYSYLVNNNFLNNNNKEINNQKNNKYFPFDLNNIILVENKDNLKQIINKELEFKKIKYSMKNNKYICWKNDSKLTIEINNFEEINNCYVININTMKQKNTIFNISFCNQLLKSIINKTL